MKKLLLMVAVLGILQACDSAKAGGDKLEIQTSSPLALAVGDSSNVLVVAKTTIDQTGRSNTVNPYTSYYLTSADTSIAFIADQQIIVGKKAGQVSITAKDLKSALISENMLIVNVSDKP